MIASTDGWSLNQVARVSAREILGPLPGHEPVFLAAVYPRGCLAAVDKRPRIKAEATGRQVTCCAPPDPKPHARGTSPWAYNQLLESSRGWRT